MLVADNTRANPASDLAAHSGTSREIHRYKACATQASSRPGRQAADGAR